MAFYEHFMYTCKHNLGFKFEHHWVPVPGWYCATCQHYLNFNPDKFPEGVAYIDKASREPKG